MGEDEDVDEELSKIKIMLALLIIVFVYHLRLLSNGNRFVNGIRTLEELGWPNGETTLDLLFLSSLTLTFDATQSCPTASRM